MLRRFDMDGDAKISFAEFEIGMRSTLVNFKSKGKQRPQSSGGYRKKRNLSRDMTALTPRKLSAQQRRRNLSRSSSSEMRIPRTKVTIDATSNRKKAVQQL